MAITDNEVKWRVTKVASYGAITDMKGATATENGKAGLVPTPITGDENKMLHGDGSWKNDIVVETLKTASGIEIY